MCHEVGANPTVPPVGFDPKSEDIGPGEAIRGVYFSAIQHYKNLADDFLQGDFNQPHHHLFPLAFLEKPGIHPPIFLIGAIPFQGNQIIFLDRADNEGL